MVLIGDDRVGSAEHLVARVLCHARHDYAGGIGYGDYDFEFAVVLVAGAAHAAFGIGGGKLGGDHGVYDYFICDFDSENLWEWDARVDEFFCAGDVGVCDWRIYLLGICWMVGRKNFVEDVSWGVY